MEKLDQQVAQMIAAKAIEMAKSTFNRPICVAVCDQFGFLLTFARMDNAPIRSIQIALGKAYTAARMGVNTDVFYERLHRDNISPSFFCDEKLTGLPGGAILKDQKGNILGAVGISGLTSKEDQVIASAMANNET